MIRMAGLLLILIPSVIMDIRRKQLPTVWLLLMSITGMVIRVLQHDDPWIMLLAAVGIAGMIYLASLPTKGLGLGDVVLICAAGIFTGPALLVPALLVSTILAAAYGGGLVMVKKAAINIRLPYAPFFAGGILVMMMLEQLGGEL